MLLMYTEYAQVQWDLIFQPDFNSPPKLKEIKKKENISQVGGTGLTGRHHKWAGQVSHRQASSQVGGAGLSRAGVIAGGWGRSHRQASQVGGAGLSQAGFSANFDNPARCVTYIQYNNMYIYYIDTILV